MKSKFYFVLVSLIIAVLSLAYQKQKTGWQGSVVEESGIKVVKNPAKPMYEKNVFILAEELSIGKAGRGEEYIFSRIRSIAVDEKERIYVLDTKEAHVKVFDKNGDYVKTVGRRGQGPGEMSLPFSINITSQNEIMVQDLNNRRIMFYSLDGNFIKSLSTAKILIVGSHIDSKGNIIGIVSTRGPEKQIIELKKFDSNLNYLYSLSSFSLASGSSFNPFMPELCWAVSKEDCVMCGYPEKYEIKVYNSEGNVIKRVVKDYKPVKITQEEIEETKKRLPGPMKLDIPQYHSAYRDFTIDEENRIFVQTWEKAGNEEGYYYDVFDSEGKYITKIPLKYPPQVWKKNRLYTIEEDEEGFHIVKRYKIMWKI